jgi:hypothetical protein
MLIKFALFAAIIAALVLLNRNSEGFQTTPTVVKLYFKIDSAGKPALIRSDNPNVTLLSSAATGGTAVLNVDTSLGVFSGFSGCGYSNSGSWVSLTTSTLDRNDNTSLKVKGTVGNSSKSLRNVIYTSGLLGTESKLPQTLVTGNGNLTLTGLVNAVFGVGTIVDPVSSATILVKLLFNSGTAPSSGAFTQLAGC